MKKTPEIKYNMAHDKNNNIEDNNYYSTKKRLFVNQNGNSISKKTTTLCENKKTCASCYYLDENYQSQLKLKTNDLKNKLSLISEILGHDYILTDCVPSPQTLNYRHIAKLVINEEFHKFRHKEKKDEYVTIFNRNKIKTEDRWINIGMYEPGTHFVFDIANCPIQTEKLNQIIFALKKEIKKQDISIYNPIKNRGSLRYVAIKSSIASSQLLITLITNDDDKTKLRILARDLCANYPEIAGVLHHINQSTGNEIFADNESDLLAGVNYLVEKINNLQLRYSAESFMQVNPLVAEKIYFRIAELSELNASSVLLDLYCGVGPIALLNAQKAGKVIGVEENKISIEDAIYNAKTNHLNNTGFYFGKTEDILPELIENGSLNNVNVVTLNPSRRGCQESVLKQLIVLKPKKIIYMSCNPVTLMRDLKFLCSNGFKAKLFEPFDMFPRTVHYEVLVMLEADTLSFN